MVACCADPINYKDVNILVISVFVRSLAFSVADTSPLTLMADIFLSEVRRRGIGMNFFDQILSVIVDFDKQPLFRSGGDTCT